MSVTCGLAYMLVVHMSCGMICIWVGSGHNYMAPFIIDFANQSFYNQFGVVLDSQGLGLLFGAMTSAQFIGNIIGIFAFSYILDTVGRRNAVTIVLNAILIPSCIMFTISEPFNAWEFYLIARVLLGFASTLVNAGAVFIGECAPDRFRGAAITFTTAGSMLWTTAGNLFAQPSVLGRQDLWHFYFLIPIPISLLHFILGFTFHKSPKCLFITKNDQNAAKNSLLFYHGPEVDIDAQFEHYTREADLTPVGNSTKLSTIWNATHLRKAFLLCLCLALYPVYSGDAVLVQYSNIVFQEYGFSQSASLYLMLAMSVLAGIFIIIASFCLIERFRRRTLVFVGHGVTMLMSVSLCLAFAIGEANAIGYLSLGVSVLCMVILLVMGGGTVGSVFFTELTPQIVRAKITQVCLLARYICDFGITLAFPAMFSVGSGYTFLGFVVLTVFVVIWLFRNLPESRNRPPDEIVGDLIERENQEEHALSNAPQTSYDSTGL